jgi:hypothetical protein
MFVRVIAARHRQSGALNQQLWIPSGSQVLVSHQEQVPGLHTGVMIHRLLISHAASMTQSILKLRPYNNYAKTLRYSVLAFKPCHIRPMPTLACSNVVYCVLHLCLSASLLAGTMIRNILNVHNLLLTSYESQLLQEQKNIRAISRH